MSRFCEAVAEITGLNAEDCQPGLQALSPTDRQRVICQDARLLDGSLCLDRALAQSDPQAARWDYGIGLRKGRHTLAIWMEVHPARSGSDVQSMLAKVHWLKTRLGESPRLQSMTQGPFRWIASGKVKIPRTGSWARQLNKNGISHPQETLRLS